MHLFLLTCCALLLTTTINFTHQTVYGERSKMRDWVAVGRELLTVLRCRNVKFRSGTVWQNIDGLRSLSLLKNAAG
jgi:hypothetical protein